jgi:MFS family permease
MSRANTEVGILGASVLLGLAVGNLLMLQPLLLAEAFGVREYAKIYSSSQLVTTLGVATGPILLGYLHDMRNYQLAYAVAAVSAVVGLILFVLSGPVDQVLLSEPALLAVAVPSASTA